MFVADAVGIDFLNSIATPVDTPVEWLATGSDLLDWLERAKLVSPEVLSTVRRGSIPGELDTVAAQARALREWFRGFVREHQGKPLKAEALQELLPLNRILERDEEFSPDREAGSHTRRPRQRRPGIAPPQTLALGGLAAPSPRESDWRLHL